MKELKISIGFGKNEKKSEEEKDILYTTVEILARVVDEKMFSSMNRVGLDEEAYIKALEKVVESYEAGDDELAKERLYMLALIIDEDSAFLLKNVIYEEKEMISWFLQYFCEYLIDRRTVDQILSEAEGERFWDVEWEDEYDGMQLEKE